MKTLEDFKQEIAEKYGCSKINLNKPTILSSIFKEASELHGIYMWNEALRWATENAKSKVIKHPNGSIVSIAVDDQSILKGLK